MAYLDTAVGMPQRPPCGARTLVHCRKLSTDGCGINVADPGHDGKRRGVRGRHLRACPFAGTHGASSRLKVHTGRGYSSDAEKCSGVSSRRGASRTFLTLLGRVAEREPE